MLLFLENFFPQVLPAWLPPTGLVFWCLVPHILPPQGFGVPLNGKEPPCGPPPVWVLPLGGPCSARGGISTTPPGGISPQNSPGRGGGMLQPHEGQYHPQGVPRPGRGGRSLLGGGWSQSTAGSIFSSWGCIKPPPNTFWPTSPTGGGSTFPACLPLLLWHCQPPPACAPTPSHY